MTEFYKQIQYHEMLNLENYCKKYGKTGKFKWKKIDIGYLQEIRIIKEDEVYVFQSCG